MSRKRALYGSVFAAVVLSSTFFAVPTASAASGSCAEDRDVCLYYNSNFKGAKYGKGENGSYNGLRFGGGAGSGQAVKNNAASVHNRNTWLTATIFYNSTQEMCRFGCQHFAPMTKGNLNSQMKNENAAQKMYHVLNKPDM